MFRMFYTTKTRGTGIGLATVKRIADAHHASIEVGEAPGGGARFRVSLRDREASAEPARPEAETSRAGQAPVGANSTGRSGIGG
jgi:K+-sensing histidine kinase KdpD